LAASPNICLKNISAVPQAGGRHISGHLIVFGLESYTFHPYNNCKKHLRIKLLYCLFKKKMLAQMFIKKLLWLLQKYNQWKEKEYL